MLLILILFITVISDDINKQVNNKSIYYLKGLISKKNTFMLITVLIYHISRKKFREHQLIFQNPLIKRGTNDKAVIFNKRVNIKHHPYKSVSILCSKTPSKMLYRSMVLCRVTTIKTSSQTLLTKSVTIYNPRANLVYEVYRFKGNAAKDLANDEKGKHPHIIVEKCEKPVCPKTLCYSPCTPDTKSRIKGHNTHKPPACRMTRYVDDKDANGDQKTQYFVPSNEKKEMETKELKAKYSSNELKPDPKGKKYVEAHHDKYQD